jgi:hypothetical protein
MVVGRAIIRDSFHGPEAQKAMSQITLVFSIAPAVAPVIGGVLLNTLGWRAMFWALLAFTLVVLAWAWRALPETHPPRMRSELHPRTLWHNYRSVIGRPEFLLLGFIPALNFCAFFLYIAGAPAFLSTCWACRRGVRLAVHSADRGRHDRRDPPDAWRAASPRRTCASATCSWARRRRSTCWYACSRRRTSRSTSRISLYMVGSALVQPSSP